MDYSNLNGGQSLAANAPQHIPRPYSYSEHRKHQLDAIQLEQIQQQADRLAEEVFLAEGQSDSSDDPYKIRQCNDLIAQIIDLLQQQHSDKEWAHEIIDRLRADSERFSAFVKEVSN